MFYYSPSAFRLHNAGNNSFIQRIFPKIFSKLGLNFIMDNNFSRYAGPNIKDMKIIRDSGGLQLGLGRKTSIDVDKVYSACEKDKVFGVMALDFPLVYNYSYEDLMQEARFQKAQTKKIEKVMNLKRLYNIVHGGSIKEFEDYHKVVFDKRLNKISFGDCFRMNRVQWFACFITFFNKWHLQKKQYKYVHILGGYNIAECTGPMIWILTHHFPKLVLTSDNSSDNQLSKRMRIVNRLTGLISREITPGFLKNCNCALCKKFKNKYNLDYNYYNVHNVYSSTLRFKQLQKDAKTMNVLDYCKKYKIPLVYVDLMNNKNVEKYLKPRTGSFNLKDRKEHFNKLWEK